MMKCLFVLVMAAMLLLSACAFAENVEPEPEIVYVEIALDQTIQLNGDFSAKVVMKPVDTRCEGGIAFYDDGEGYSYSFKVRWNEAKRADFYGAKDVGGAWKGFLIADEYQEWLKDCFVSVDEGWDATTDTQMTLIVTVKGTMATVTMQGDVTGKEGTVHFDLTKSPWLDWEEKEAEPLVKTVGGLHTVIAAGEAVQLFVDKATYDANQK